MNTIFQLSSLFSTIEGQIFESEGLFAYNISLSFSGMVWYCVLATALAGVLCWLPVAFAPKKITLEKNSSYECGFEPFFNNNTKHEVHFIVVSILFVIFDLELVLLAPMVSSSMGLGAISYDMQMVFAYLLTAGLIYEWFSGVLNWPVFYWTTSETK